ncbi:uncharacterized protein LOC133893169 [Phragmites australis]|uniref:uncharacterized protein LOC133893169 n=1 Tax=Phragmites australis TaxID=29695 RepID=UPI002D775D84|nr:uncharacterized protein LOC133893169 [Phragmites australis]
MSRGSGKLHVSWLWRVPRRALRAARDLYVRSLTGCAGHLPGDAAFGYPSFAGVPAFSADSLASSSRRSVGDVDDDLRELIRAASQRRAAESAAAAQPATVPRSQSVAMTRIDEDRPCEFGAGAALFPRSQSCAAGAGRLSGRRGRVAALAA